jgi:hypothetical protein
MDVNDFLEIFFGPGNLVWPDRDPDSNVGKFLGEYLCLLTEQSDVPYILPRNDPTTRRRFVYVVPRQSRHAAVVREWLTAFVVPSHAYFIREAYPVRADDPIDLAVQTFVGHAKIYVVEYPAENRSGLWRALARMRDAVRQRPPSTWFAPVPVGRLLAEFDLAMAAGDHSASAELLGRLAATGMTGMNVSYLTVKRLARLGCHGQLLRLPELRSVVAACPPGPVREAILDAMYSTAIAEPLSRSAVADARDALAVRGGELVPALADGPLTGFGVEALTVLAVAASSMDDKNLIARLRQEEAWAAVTKLVPDLVEAGAENVAPDFNPNSATPVPPMSWLELVVAVAAGDDIRKIIAEESWKAWPAAADADDKIAKVLSQLDNDGAERAWSIVGSFVDSDRYQRPASLTAREFLANALTHSRFGPGDLAGIVALTEIALRSGLASDSYRSLLDDLNAETNRWVSVDRASIVLDLADLLARAPCPDPEARVRLTGALLRPLNAQQTRLEVDQLELARKLGSELGLELFWGSSNADSETDNLVDVPACNVLLYSLDEHVLDRTRNTLQELAPRVTITCSNDYVGSRQLKQWARRADVIVMATRCATHAATGFIRANAQRGTVVLEADGSGSASLLRAATASLLQRPT